MTHPATRCPRKSNLLRLTEKGCRPRVTVFYEIVAGRYLRNNETSSNALGSAAALAATNTVLSQRQLQTCPPTTRPLRLAAKE